MTIDYLKTNLYLEKYTIWKVGKPSLIARIAGWNRFSYDPEIYDDLQDVILDDVSMLGAAELERSHYPDNESYAYAYDQYISDNLLLGLINKVSLYYEQQGSDSVNSG